MKLYEKIRQQKLVSTALLLVDAIDWDRDRTLVNTGVNAARNQQNAAGCDAAGDSACAELRGTDFTKLARKLDPSVVNITAD